MHILITSPAFPPFIGGGERHVGTLAKCLIENGHAVTVLTSAAVTESDFWQGCGQAVEVEIAATGSTVIRSPIRPIPGGLYGLLAWRKTMILLSALRFSTNLLFKMAERVPSLIQIEEACQVIEDPVDIVHGFNISWEHAMMAGWQYARQNNIPFVASPLAHLGTGPRDRVAKNSTMRHQRYMLSTSDLLITNTAKEAHGLQGKGINVVGFRVAGPGVDIPKQVAPLPEADQSIKPYVLFIGRASYDKGAFHAVEAVLHLRAQGCEVQLVVIGGESDAFHRFHQGLTHQERQVIHTLGFVDEDVKHAYLRDAAALLLPSRTDSFGIVLLESWLYGRPVIAADAGGIPAVVDHNQNGILIPFGDVTALADAIKLLLEDIQLNQALGRNGRKKLMENFTWEVVTKTVLDAYRMVIDRHNSNVKLA
ncbi:MAG: glycosyltransferase family 4 protein [Candidatus Promineifilaceae bacterium]|nr:glycosyltransferase family 4 protein [Candidatus Promineifilaceae bacterium]